MICADCPTPISGKGATGRCKPCASRMRLRDPEFAARRLAAQRKAMADPAYRARKRLERQRVEAERRNDPAWRAYKQASGKRLRAVYDASAEAQAKNKAQRVQAGLKISATRLAHIPEAYRPRYRALRKSHGVAYAEQVVLAEAAAAARRVLDADAAAGWLARFAPTYRCDESGRLCRTSGYWRHGSRVLTRDALLERAARRGWPPAQSLATAPEAM